MHSPRVPLAFTSNPLDRASEKRCDLAWLEAKRREPQSLILPLWRLQPLLLGDPGGGAPTLGLLDAASAAQMNLPEGQEVLLGLGGETAYFARDISALGDPLASGFAPLGYFREVRASASLLTLPEIAILGQAKAMMEWHSRTGFCSACGGATESADAGYRRVCRICTAEHFPRTDPVVIMLVTDGENCLLARNKRYGDNVIYSTLAGFVEPGETIDEAVRREVLEEVGIRTGMIRFFASQPWPFPHSLMIGCYAEAEDRDIMIDGNEIVAARWFARDEIRSIIAGTHSGDIGLPRREAIAFHLIQEWAGA